MWLNRLCGLALGCFEVGGAVRILVGCVTQLRHNSDTQVFLPDSMVWHSYVTDKVCLLCLKRGRFD